MLDPHDPDLSPFAMFRSVLVPLQAIILNALSLAATFGSMVWVFQHGNGSHLLRFTHTGITEISTPILMFCIAFGLSMDYEIFLLSRIRRSATGPAIRSRRSSTGSPGRDGW